MEVHAHTHTPDSHREKKWTHYLWEFLMLFLAVFCGFLAENLRENRVEHKRTLLYANQFLEEIKLDTAQLNFVLSVVKQKKILVDSLLAILRSPSEKNWRDLYYFSLNVDNYHTVAFHKASFEQIKNSGSLRNFNNEELVKSIQQYINARDYVEIVQNALADYYNKNLTAFINKNFDKNIGIDSSDNSSHDYFNSLWSKSSKPGYFLSGQKNAQTEFTNMLIDLRTSYNLTTWYSSLKENSIQLIALLQKEYHLK